jgi:rhamnogalacturonan hydrolase
MSTSSGDGVQLTNVTIKNWKGTESDGSQRGPIKVKCAEGAPCKELTIEDFAMWTESGSEQWYSCENAYGSGACLNDGDDYSSYTTTQTVTSTPSGYSAATMASDLATAFGTESPIPIPAIPTSFYPGATPASALAGAKATSSCSCS